MKNRKETLRKIVSYLNNPDEEGGFWLPNIQRPFVWTEEQICRLFDSILREYPISTLLIWKTNSDVRRRKFIDNWRDGLKLSDFYVPDDTRKKCLVLDGQQRLQSLFIALKGSYEGRELYFDILSGEVAAPDDVKYGFAFLEKEKAEFPWVRFKDLVFTSRRIHQVAADLENAAGRALNDNERGKVQEHLALVERTFKSDESITYQELDSIDNPELYGDDDVVEIFIRANSGGTRLGKSDLLFSLLTSTWDDADRRMEELLEAINRTGFRYTRDFILKTCLTLLDQGAQYQVDKFRKPEIRQRIEDSWDAISAAIRDVHDFVSGKTFIRTDKAIPSYLALIPLIYARYHFPDQWRSAKDIDAFLLRTLLSGAFGLTPDRLIDSCAARVKAVGGFDAAELFGMIRASGRSLEITEDRFWSMGYGSGNAHLLFNLWYRDFNYAPAYESNLPQIDHIFPQSRLRRIKDVNPENGHRTVMRFKEYERNQLANCMLLSAAENGAGGKGDATPDAWFSNKDAAYLSMHLIPTDKSLWQMDRFEDFISARRQMLAAHFGSLLLQQARPLSSPPSE